MLKKFNLYTYTNIKFFFLKLIYFSRNNEFFNYVYKNRKISRSQNFQDLFVSYFSNNKKKGFFVEIGGGNGVDISNTYILEKKFNWDGIICEPNKIWFSKIKKERKAKLITKPITKICERNKFFYHCKDPYKSTIKKNNETLEISKINTLCLNHLLKNIRKKKIDYISIDTEGNELDIIKKFNFNKHDIKIFTIEHNFENKKRDKIYKIMKKNNYKRVFKYLSYMDDWYIKDF